MAVEQKVYFPIHFRQKGKKKPKPLNKNKLPSSLQY